MSDSSQTRLASIAEVTAGITPTSPVFKVIRYTGESLKASQQYVSSNEIRADRNVSDITNVGGSGAGAVNMEMTYGTFDDWLEGVMNGTWSTNVLKNGVTAKSFTLEKLFENGATDNFHRFLGAKANTLNLSLQSNQQVTGSFDFLAQSFSKGTAILSGATYTAANTNPVMNAAENVANLAITGVTSPQVSSMSLSITNNLAQQPVIGSKWSKGIRAGRCVVTGTLEAYFENAELYDLYMDNIASDLTFDIGGASSLKYNFDLNKVKFIDGEVIAGGNDQDVMARMQFQSYYDASDASSIKITRTP